MCYENFLHVLVKMRRNTAYQSKNAQHWSSTIFPEASVSIVTLWIGGDGYLFYTKSPVRSHMGIQDRVSSLDDC